MLVGVCAENGDPSLFKDAVGAIWGINQATGKFERLGTSLDKCKGKFAPLSPVFVEIKSNQQILDEAKESLK